MTPRANGCICQTCSDRGTECDGVCDTEWDEQCPACLDGHHIVNEKGQRMRRYAAALGAAQEKGEAGS